MAAKDINNPIRLCTICARGGSVGVPMKNIKEIGGKPLISHSLEQAKNSGLFDCIAVSSDSFEILDIADKFGADVLVTRPVDLATNNAAKLPAIRHCVAEVEAVRAIQFNTIVDLDATSPLRSLDDIRNCVNMLESGNAQNVITATPSRRSPYFNMIEFNEYDVPSLVKKAHTNVCRRQDAPKTYDMNASIYVWNRVALFGSINLINSFTKVYIMPEDRSLDIDSELDFQIVEYLMNRRLS